MFKAFAILQTDWPSNQIVKDCCFYWILTVFKYYLANSCQLCCVPIWLLHNTSDDRTPFRRQDISQLNPDKELVQDEVDCLGLKKEGWMCFGSRAQNCKYNVYSLKAVVDNRVFFCFVTGSDVSFGKYTLLLWEPYQLRPLLISHSWNRPTVAHTHNRRAQCFWESDLSNGLLNSSRLAHSKIVSDLVKLR